MMSLAHAIRSSEPFCFLLRRMRISGYSNRHWSHVTVPLKSRASDGLRFITSSRRARSSNKKRQRIGREPKTKTCSEMKEISNSTEMDHVMGRRTLSFVHGLLRYWKPNPRIPGGSRDLFHRSHRLQLAYRFLALTALCLLVENDDVSPISLDMSQGPSMLPTFASIGDVFLRETGAWYRFLGIPITYQRGDLVVFRDENGCYAGKRIIGVAGDEVMLYGEYVHLYLSWPNWAINTSVTDGVATYLKTTDGRDARQRIMVPPGHVWLEGDCPPFSRDSRHYGPISVDRIRGRILYRIWPWQGELITRNRPHPLTIEEALSGKYNLFPIRRHH